MQTSYFLLIAAVKNFPCGIIIYWSEGLDILQMPFIFKCDFFGLMARKQKRLAIDLNMIYS